MRRNSNAAIWKRQDRTEEKRSVKVTKMTEKILSSSKMGNRLDVTLWTVWFLSLLKLQRRKTERGNGNVSK